MKVLMLLQFPLYGNGSGTYSRKLAKYLSKMGHEVAIACPDHRKFEEFKTHEIKTPIKAVFVSNPEFKGASRYIDLNSKDFSKIYNFYLHRVVEIVNEFQPDVIHVNHCFFLTWIASYIKYLYGIAYVVTAHGTGIMQCSLDRRYLGLTRQALSNAEYLIPVSKHSKKWMLKNFRGNLRRKTRIITGAIDLESLYSTKEFNNAKLLKKYNLDPERKRIVFVGRLTEEKGLPYLIRAAKHLKNVDFLILGDGDQKKNLEALSKEKGTKNVKFLGYFGKENLKDLHNFYYACDIFVLPSVVDEALPIVILEAMSYGIPVVASNKGGIPMIVKNGINGFVVRSRSAKALVIAFRSILSDQAVQDKFSRNALKLMNKKFGWGYITPKIVNLYEKAVERTDNLRKNRKYAYLTRQEIKREERELKDRLNLLENGNK
ncbi:glycosyltransferase family 4 protein [Patescibacteria group bacterium]